MEGKGALQTSSPCCPSTACPASSKTSVFMPSPRHWISPRYTGCHGLPRQKHEMMSVPPEMDARCRSPLIFEYTKSYCSGASGEPVETIVRSAARSNAAAGAPPSFSSAARYFGLVPKCVTRSRSAMRHSTSRSGAKGEPS